RRRLVGGGVGRSASPGGGPVTVACEVALRAHVTAHCLRAVAGREPAAGSRTGALDLSLSQLIEFLLRDPEGLPPPAVKEIGFAAQQGGSREGLRAVRGQLYQSAGGPPAAPLLAVRAARRAVAANPDSADGYLKLYDAYFHLSSRTRERAWGP